MSTGITIRDVAIKAGVSITTVSHVVNKTRFVSKELCERVYAAMEELNYRPNTLARSLRMGETKTIGLIIPDNSNPFFAELARIIEDIGFENGYSVILCNSDNIHEKEFAYINMLIAKQIDGVIFIAAGNNPEHLVELIKRNIPVVVIDRNIANAAVDVVLVDNEKGGFDVVNYLLGLGHKKIACISGPSKLTPSIGRVKGYRKALKQAGIPIRENYIISGDFRSPSGEAATLQLLRLPEPPTAIFACNDLMALGALRALRNAGLSVPQEISIIGFDDIDLADEITPPLTTVAQPIAELATSAVEILISRIQESTPRSETQRKVLNAWLVIRESCAQVNESLSLFNK
jgi:LacI family transcriptional regulator